MSRIHIVLDAEEKERFRREAELEGKSLSEWVREAARARLAAGGRPRLETPEALRAFWSECDARESGREPDWHEHREVIEGSIGGGSART